MGNHEEAFINGNYSGSNVLVNNFFVKCFYNFNRFEQIQKFDQEYIFNEFKFCHTILGSYIYPDTHVVLDRNYIIGHSHHQFVYNQNDFVLYNAGSVGQNRKFINVANYLILDSETMHIECKAVRFNIDQVISEIQN